MVETEASGSSSSVSAPDIDGTAPDTDDETPSNSEPVGVQRFELNVQTLGSGWEYELVVDVEEHAAIDFDKDVTGLPPGTARVTSSASPGLQQVSVTSTAPERMPPSPRTGVVAVWNDPGIDGVVSETIPCSTGRAWGFNRYLPELSVLPRANTAVCDVAALANVPQDQEPMDESEVERLIPVLNEIFSGPPAAYFVTFGLAEDPAVYVNPYSTGEKCVFALFADGRVANFPSDEPPSEYDGYRFLPMETDTSSRFSPATMCDIEGPTVFTPS